MQKQKIFLMLYLQFRVVYKLATKRLSSVYLFSVHILKIVTQWHFHIHSSSKLHFPKRIVSLRFSWTESLYLGKCGRTTSSFVPSQRLCKCRTCFSIGGLSQDITRCQDLLCVIEFIITCDMISVVRVVVSSIRCLVLLVYLNNRERKNTYLFTFLYMNFSVGVISIVNIQINRWMCLLFSRRLRISFYKKHSRYWWILFTNY